MTETDEGEHERNRHREAIVDRFVETLDKAMARSQLVELGWRDRDDIGDVLRDLEILSHTAPAKAIELWNKYRPDDQDKPIFIDGDDKDPIPPPSKKVKQNSKDTVDQSQTPKAQKSGEGLALEVPLSIQKRFLQAEDTYYYRDEAGTLAFKDKDKKLTTEYNDPNVIGSMVELAKAKGWEAIKVKGSNDFRREVWLQASLKGLEIEGYTPRDVDVARLADIKKEQQNPHIKSRTRFERSAARSTVVVTDLAPGDQTPTLSDPQRVMVEALKAMMRARGDSDKAVAMAAEVLGDRFDSNRVYVGKIIDHGVAPFENEPKNKYSPFVTLQTQIGQRTVWGVDIPRAMEASEAKTGDEVALAHQGKKQTTVKFDERDESGQVVGQKEVQVYRNAWEMQKFDVLRDELKRNVTEAATRAERLSVLQVYDRDASRSEPRPELSLDRQPDKSRTRG